MIKKLVILLILVVFLALLYSLSHQIIDTLQSSYRLSSAEDEVVALQTENSRLKGQLSEVGSAQYIEQQARDKLNMSLPGDRVFIISQSEIAKIVKVGQNTAPVKENLPYWKGWLRLFFL